MLSTGFELRLLDSRFRGNDGQAEMLNMEVLSMVHSLILTIRSQVTEKYAIRPLRQAQGRLRQAQGERVSAQDGVQKPFMLSLSKHEPY